MNYDKLLDRQADMDIFVEGFYYLSLYYQVKAKCIIYVLRYQNFLINEYHIVDYYHRI
jgi:hypothetical protein